MENKIYSKVFTWLFIGLLITFGSGYILSVNELLAVKVLSFGIFPIVIIELIIAFLMGIRIQKMNPLTAKICYIIYCITTGLTFSSIFMIYEIPSLLLIFLATSVTFLLLSIYGASTKKDLSGVGTLMFVALIVSIVFSLLNALIFKSSMLEAAICGFGVLLFCGYIAYDMNKMKSLLLTLGEEKGSLYGAFQLYLDFINLFVRLLELFGKRKD